MSQVVRDARTYESLSRMGTGRDEGDKGEVRIAAHTVVPRAISGRGVRASWSNGWSKMPRGWAF